MSEQKWVNVEDKLPEPDSYVLVAYDLLEPCFQINRKAVSTGHIGCKRYISLYNNCNIWDDEKYHRVTHWQYLPEAPKD